MSGAGFFAGTMSPAYTPAILARRPGPLTEARTASTLFSADVDAQATCQPASSASAMMRAIPVRPGRAPASTSST